MNYRDDLQAMNPDFIETHTANGDYNQWTNEDKKLFESLVLA